MYKARGVEKVHVNITLLKSLQTIPEHVLSRDHVVTLAPAIFSTMADWIKNGFLTQYTGCYINKQTVSGEFELTDQRFLR
jgi:hypothetical protein